MEDNLLQIVHVFIAKGAYGGLYLLSQLKRNRLFEFLDFQYLNYNKIKLLKAV